MAHPTNFRTNQPLAVTDFIQKFNDRLKEKNIIKDNVYNMVKTTYKSWENMFKKNVNKIVNIEKFKEVQIIVIFCANATDSNKLPPFFIFKNGNEEIKEYAKDQSEFISKTERDMLTKESEIFAYWYRNYFMEYVRKYQKMKAKNVNNKVILLLKDCKEFSSLLEVKESDFETMYFPTNYLTDLQPLHNNLIMNFRQKLRKHTFSNSINIKDCLNFISNLWTTSFQDKLYFHLWNKLFQRNVIEENTAFKEIPEDPQNSGPKKLQKEEATIGEIVEPVLSMEENNPSTSFGTPKLELNKNVIEENTAFKEVPEDPQNSDPEKLQQEEAIIGKIVDIVLSMEENNPSTSFGTPKLELNKYVIEENTVFKEVPEDPQNSDPEKLQQEKAIIGKIVDIVLSMEENNPSTSFGTPKLELNKNVIEENTVFKEVPEDPQNSDPEKLQQEEAAIEKTLETPTKKHRREENIIEESTVFKAILGDSQTSRAEIFPQEETDLKDI
ncbi:uncharacterized protein [Anoplolepis gracilipes]|uniref:uncharacterized protein n=1 Tax=Anoplolepis gracilipes TaxID=354296 RepID=UPI003B9FCF1C